MAWETVRLRDSSGKPVGKKHRKLILGFVEEALGNPHLDPDLLIKIARAAARDVAGIRNLSAYLRRAIFRASQNAFIEEQEIIARFEELYPYGEVAMDERSSNQSIELQILIRELFETLDELDREIYLRRLRGFKFQEIDEALSLKPRTSEYRFREAALRLRRLLETRTSERRGRP